MVTAIIGAITAAVSAAVAVGKGVQARRTATRTQTQAEEDYHQANLIAMRQGSRAQLAANRQAVLAAQAEQMRLLNESKEQQKKAILLGSSAVVLGMFVLALRK